MAAKADQYTPNKEFQKSMVNAMKMGGSPEATENTGEVTHMGSSQEGPCREVTLQLKLTAWMKAVFLQVWSEDIWETLRPLRGVLEVLP